MAESRSKLLLLSGPHVSAETVEALLRGRIDVKLVTPDQAKRAIHQHGDHATLVVAEASAVDSLAQTRCATGFESALDAIQSGVCVCRADGEILWMSQRFRSYGEPLRTRVAELCRTRDESDALDADPCEFEIQTPHGVRLLETTVSPIIGGGSDNGDGQCAESVRGASFVVMARDVTTQRQKQRTIEAIEHAGQELLQFDVDSVRQLNAAQRLTLLQDRIVAYAQELMQFDHFAVRLLDQESGRLDLVMSVGLTPEAAEHVMYAKPEGSGISGLVAATGESYLCRDTTKDPRYITGLATPASSITTPLHVREMVAGVFNVERVREQALTEEDMRYAEIFARYISTALHILDLLVVEQWTTNEAISGAMRGEMSEPLDDLEHEAAWLRSQPATDPVIAQHVDRILSDVDSIRRRFRDVARGPRTILGADRALRDVRVEPALRGKRVLVADDEKSIRETIREVLARRGCEVIVCENGAEALQRIEEAQRQLDGGGGGGEGSAGFDLIVSDIKMEDRNGYEVFSAAKRLRADLPVILMTGFGYDPHHSIVRASQEGLQCVLFKPFQAERLLDEVRTSLTGAASPPTGRVSIQGGSG